MRFGVMIAAAAALLCAGQASATEFRTYSAQLGYGGGFGPYFVSGLPQFDAKLGTLESVTFSYDDRFQQYGAVFSYDQNFNPATSLVSITGGISGLQLGSLAVTTLSQAITAPFQASGRQEVLLETKAQASVTTSTGLAGFIGTGYILPSNYRNGGVSVTVTPITATRASFSPIDFGGTLNYSVTYGFSAIAAAVPEPATWAMLLVGVGAIGATLRRRNRQLAASA